MAVGSGGDYVAIAAEEVGKKVVHSSFAHAVNSPAETRNLIAFQKRVAGQQPANFWIYPSAGIMFAAVGSLD